MRKAFLLLAAWQSLAIAYPPGVAFAQSDPTSMPARETHQGVTIAVRPLISEAAYKTQFAKHSLFEAGILALEVFVRNDNEKPVRMKLDTMRLFVELAGQQRQRVEPLTSEQVADRVLFKTPGNPTAPRLPIPGPRRPTSNRDKNWEAFAKQVQASTIPSDVVGPKATVHGFLYFDVNHHYDWLSSTRLDVPDIAFMVNNEPLFFFQVDLAPALH